jgi:hypothetical protein
LGGHSNNDNHRALGESGDLLETPTHHDERLLPQMLDILKQVDVWPVGPLTASKSYGAGKRRVLRR